MDPKKAIEKSQIELESDFSVQDYNQTIKQLFIKANPHSTISDPDELDLLSIIKNGRVSKSKVFSLLQESNSSKSLDYEIFEFIRRLEITVIKLIMLAIHLRILISHLIG
jgi:hypothetical protein